MGFKTSGASPTILKEYILNIPQINKERLNLSQHVIHVVVTQVTTVTRVCVDYDSYLKIGPNEKKRGSDCHAHRALFALGTTTIFETLVFIPRVCDWSVYLGTSMGHTECLRSSNGGLFP